MDEEKSKEEGIHILAKLAKKFTSTNKGNKGRKSLPVKRNFSIQGIYHLHQKTVGPIGASGLPRKVVHSFRSFFNRAGLNHLVSDQNFLDFGLNGKHPMFLLIAGANSQWSQ